MNTFGIFSGLAGLLIIGLGFPLIIHGERRFGLYWWPYMMGVGITFVIASLFILNDWASVLIGVFGATLVWGSTELKHQSLRARLGWFPFNSHKIKPPFEGVIRKWKVPHL